MIIVNKIVKVYNNFYTRPGYRLKQRQVNI